MTFEQLHELLETQAARFNQPSFIENDPISVPHRFTHLPDKEIAAFIAATLAWGSRKSIINSANNFLACMDNDPHRFVLHCHDTDLKGFVHFKHRTFNPTDALYFVEFFRWYYARHTSLEHAFTQFLQPQQPHAGPALAGFHQLFFNLPFAPTRTQKHVPNPLRNSACKRLNMFLRWMVRTDNCGVDFGLWKKINPAQLLCPLDVHVDRIARMLNLLQRKQTDWQAVLELTANLRRFNPADPVKYDFALFGMGLLQKNNTLEWQ
ncbi:TIGR02757 family protein [Sphingobacteriales bacterium UPWRP_1]|nr:TIGR02757 family protein [Sphingobacteriales bacterium TSM_CSS]PSJ78318.1 TIGR02757 family protein [Sphingobacteriales bacterium UPWRP_1]